MKFLLDGQPVEAGDPPPWTTLLDWLRAGDPQTARPPRTGTKEGCAEGDCGACAVLLVDRRQGPPRLRLTNACLTLIGQVAGQEVFTCEGLGRPGALHPVQQALVDRAGSQCGYCTPGFVMALAEAAHRPELAEAQALAARQDALSGNLCRCTGYRPLRDALEATAGTCPDDVLRQALERPGSVDPVESGTAQGGFFAPTRLSDLFARWAQAPAARLVAGATDLGLEITMRHARPPVLLSLERLPELRGLVEEPGALRIGAAEPLAEIEDAAQTRFPPLARMLRFFGSRAIKQRGTLGGNLATASPIGDLAPLLLALDAELVLASAEGERSVPAEAFFLDYRRTALRPGELIQAVRLPYPGPADRVGVYKVSRRKEMDISAVSLVGRVRLDPAGRVEQAWLAFGGLAATPQRARRAEAALQGASWDQAGVAPAQLALEEDFQPLTDVRGSAAFRRALARNLLLGFALETAQAPFVPTPPVPTGAVVLPVPGGARG